MSRGSISDDVWSSLDWNAGKLTSRSNGLSFLVVAGLILVLLAGHWMLYSGTVLPRVVADPHGWGSSLRIVPREYREPATTKRIYTSVTLVNEGWFAVEILGIGADMPGMKFDHIGHQGFYETGENFLKAGSVPLPTPLRIESGYGGNVIVELHYTVTDCQAVPSTPQPIPVRVARQWGEQTVFVLPPALRPNDGGFSVTTRDDPLHVEWQRFLADDVCDMRLE